MLIDKDEVLLSENNKDFKMAVFSTIGGRDDQQDSVGYKLFDDGGIFAVCDGMGGHKGGKLASSIAVNSILDHFDDNSTDYSINEMLMSGVNDADNKIAALTDENGELLRGGSTAAVAVIKDRALYWISVGDSRIYVCRKGEFVQITTDHIYEVALRENIDAGLISKEFYDREYENAEALISFVGIGEIPLVDKSVNPLPLQSDDVILIMTDGLYKNVEDEIMQRCIENFRNPSDSMRALENRVRKMTEQDGSVRDNMTVVQIRII